MAIGWWINLLQLKKHLHNVLGPKLFIYLELSQSPFEFRAPYRNFFQWARKWRNWSASVSLHYVALQLHWMVIIWKFTVINALAFNCVVYGMRNTGMQWAVLNLPSRAAYGSWLFARFGRKNWFLFAVIIHFCTQFVGMAVQEDVLRIKKSLEKMIQNKSVVNGS